MPEQSAIPGQLRGTVEVAGLLGHEVATTIGQQVSELAIAALRPPDSPRLAGLDEAHAQRLAEIEGPLPPILVQRTTMRIVDGAHRARAAQILGRDRIPARFVDAEYETAFMIGVAANSCHGLPLSLADRESAATRILAAYPNLSDRAIAEIAGLSPRTIGKIRRCSTGDNAHLDSRIGRDGRLRPLNASAARQRVVEAVAENPAASLRKIAIVAGVSPSTVRDVRRRMARGQNPTSPNRRGSSAAKRQLDAQPLQLEPRTNRPALLASLARDPSLRYTESGRYLLRWLDRRLEGLDNYDDLYDKIPAHCTDLIARLALQSAAWWVGLYDRLQERDQEPAAVATPAPTLPDI